MQKSAMWRRDPAPESNGGPDCLDQAKWPSALQEAVYRPERARKGEQQHEPMATSFQRVAYKHCRDGDEATGRKTRTRVDKENPRALARPFRGASKPRDICHTDEEVRKLAESATDDAVA